MSKTRNLSDLLDANGDVKATALDNVPASDVVNDTSPQLGGDLASNGNDILMADNDKIKLGTGNDLSIYHDGSRSIIQDSGTGNLRIQAENLELNNADNSENYIFCGHNGAVELYHDNSKKFETSSSGATVTGTLTADGVSVGDNENINVGASNDLQIYHDGTNSYIEDNGTGNLRLNGNEVQILSNDNSEYSGRFITNGAVELYHDNSKKFETTSSGATVTGTLTATAFSGDGSALTNVPAGVSSVKTFFITSSQTYTPTSGTKFVTVYCNGAGGGGGNRSGSTISGSKGQQGGGGGAGGMAIRTFDATELGSSASITIGSGGSGGASHHDPRHGSTGGNTTFNPAGTGNTLTGNGGTGGKGNNGTWHGLSGEGGTASGGTINIVGQSGYQNTLISSSNSTARNDSGDGVFGGNGGRTMWTGGGLNKAVGTGEVETSGANGANGCGGQGASARAGYQAGGSGGSGGSGYVLIMEYA